MSIGYIEGSASPVNDVPITVLARAIDIDLREMLGETEVPTKIEPKNNILL